MPRVNQTKNKTALEEQKRKQLDFLEAESERVKTSHSVESNVVTPYQEEQEEVQGEETQAPEEEQMQTEEPEPEVEQEVVEAPMEEEEEEHYVENGEEEEEAAEVPKGRKPRKKITKVQQEITEEQNKHGENQFTIPKAAFKRLCRELIEEILSERPDITGGLRVAEDAFKIFQQSTEGYIHKVFLDANTINELNTPGKTGTGVTLNLGHFLSGLKVSDDICEKMNAQVEAGIARMLEVKKVNQEKRRKTRQASLLKLGLENERRKKLGLLSIGEENAKRKANGLPTIAQEQKAAGLAKGGVKAASMKVTKKKAPGKKQKKTHEQVESVVV